MELSWFTKKVRVSDLKLLDYNPRSITEAEKRKLLRSLETFGLADIPVVNQDFTVISGNQRVKCLLDLGRDDEEVDVRWPTRKLTKTEVKEYAITANTHNGVWDFDMLQEHFAEVPVADFGIVVPVAVPDINLDKFFPQNQGTQGTAPSTGEDNRPSITPSTPDYSELERGNTDLKEGAQSLGDGLRKAIMVDFSPEDYLVAYKKVGDLRAKGYDLGALFLAFLGTLEAKAE